MSRFCYQKVLATLFGRLPSHLLVGNDFESFSSPSWAPSEAKKCSKPLCFTVFFASRTLFFVSLFACILDPKNLPKTLPKRGSNPSKIDVKNVLFFNIDFFGFWPQVGRSWRPKMEASWLQIPSSSLLGCPL